jgi:hypothetical protein
LDEFLKDEGEKVQYVDSPFSPLMLTKMLTFKPLVEYISKLHYTE